MSLQYEPSAPLHQTRDTIAPLYQPRDTLHHRTTPPTQGHLTGTPYTIASLCQPRDTLQGHLTPSHHSTDPGTRYRDTLHHRTTIPTQAHVTCKPRDARTEFRHQRIWHISDSHLLVSLLLSSLELSDTTTYEPSIRALLGTAPHFC